MTSRPRQRQCRFSNMAKLTFEGVVENGQIRLSPIRSRQSKPKSTWPCRILKTRAGRASIVRAPDIPRRPQT
jgi:hypothetical protein